MKLTVLGSGTLIPYPNRGNSGYFLETDQYNVLIDGGSGALRQMANFDLDYTTIDVVTYTHLHPDHTMDLVPLLFSFRHDPRVIMPRDLKIIGPVGFGHYFDRMMDIHGEYVLSSDLEVEIEEVSTGSITLQDLKITAGPSEHTENSVTYRFKPEGGGDLFYSGDTGMSEELVQSAMGVDVLVLECSFPDDERHANHLTPSLCGKIASQSSCSRLILTHFYPHVLEEDIVESVSKQFSGEIQLAHDGMEIEI